MNQTRHDHLSLPYRDCVGVALFNNAGLVFMGRRLNAGDAEESAALGAPWQMPQGGIELGEAPLAAARRELFEETNVRSARLLMEAPDWIVYDLPEELVGVAFKGRYRGQRQRWFAFAFTGDESEIDVVHPAAGAAPAEFGAWRWEALERTPELIVPFKRAAYRQVVATFRAVPERARAP